MHRGKLAKSPLPSFITSSKVLFHEESDLQRVCTSDFNNPLSLGRIIKAKLYGLNKAQKLIQSQQSRVAMLRVAMLRIDLSYIPSQQVKISWRCKDNQSLAQCITTEETNHDKRDNSTSNSKLCVFHKLQPSTSQQRPFVFSKMRTDETPKSYMFHRLKGNK